jgi:hypothetical protein
VSGIVDFQHVSVDLEMSKEFVVDKNGDLSFLVITPAAIQNPEKNGESFKRHSSAGSSGTNGKLVLLLKPITASHFLYATKKDINRISLFLTQKALRIARIAPIKVFLFTKLLLRTPTRFITICGRSLYVSMIQSFYNQRQLEC